MPVLGWRRVLLLELWVGLPSRVAKSGVSHGKGEGHVVHAGVNCICIVCGSTHSSWCVVEYYYYCDFTLVYQRVGRLSM